MPMYHNYMCVTSFQYFTLAFPPYYNSAATVSFNAAEETVKLEFPSELATGEVTLVIEYTGTLNDQMRGFYRSKYTDPTSPGKEKYAATTQFEVIYRDKN